MKNRTKKRRIYERYGSPDSFLKARRKYERMTQFDTPDGAVTATSDEMKMYRTGTIDQTAFSNMRKNGRR